MMIFISLKYILAFIGIGCVGGFVLGIYMSCKWEDKKDENN